MRKEINVTYTEILCYVCCNYEMHNHYDNLTEILILLSTYYQGSEHVPFDLLFIKVTPSISIFDKKKKTKKKTHYQLICFSISLNIHMGINVHKCAGF